MAIVGIKYRYKDGVKRFGGYYVEFYDPQRRPKRKRISVRTDDESVAHRRANEFERKAD